MTGMVGDFEPVPETMRAAATKGYPTATDLADWLVSVAGLPFREAHQVTGEIVKAARPAGVLLDQFPVADMQEIDARITDDVLAVLSIDAALARRTSEGGTGT